MIAITVETRFHPALMEIDIDCDSFLVTCRVSEPHYRGPIRSTSDLYSDLFGIRRSARLLTINDLVVTVVEPDRLLSIEWRAGPAVLRSQALVEPQGRAVTLHINAEWDEDGKADVPGHSFGVFDPMSRALAIQLGPEPVEWVSPADGLQLGLCASGGLAGVYLRPCPVDLCNLVGC